MATVLVLMGVSGAFAVIGVLSGGADYGLRPQGSFWAYKPPPPGVEVPRTYLGDLALLYVGDRWAMGRVIDSSRLIEIGDQVELK